MEQATNKTPRDPQIADFQKKKRKKGIVKVKLTVYDSRTFGNSSLEVIPMSTQPPTSAYTGYPLGHLATDQNLKPFSNITASATPHSPNYVFITISSDANQAKRAFLPNS